MAMNLGPHAFYIVAAYAVTAVIVGALILGAVRDHRMQLRALAELEGRGVRRRSGRSPSVAISGDKASASTG
jgi:heme exporter protein D